MRYATLILFPVLGWLAAGCSGGSDLAGGSETTNGIEVASTAGTVTVSGRPGISVSLYGADYDPVFRTGFSDTSVVGDSGRCRFVSVAQGRYNVLARDSSAHLAAMVFGVPVSAGSAARVGAVLVAPGAIEGRVTRTDIILSACILGSPLEAAVDSTGRFVLEGVPPGAYTVHVRQTFSRMSTEPAYADSAAVTINQGERVHVDID